MTVKTEFELTDRWGRSAATAVTVRRDTVEVRCRGVLVGIADRDYLCAWLRAPVGVYAVDDIAWIPAPMGGAVALAIEDVVPAEWLSDQVLAGLRESV